MFAIVPVAVALNELPDAPVPAMESSSGSVSMFTLNTTTSKTVTQTKKHRWLTAYNASVATLIVGEVVDTWGTHRNMIHPKFLCGYNATPGFGAAISTAKGDIGFQQIQSLCGEPGGRSANFAYDVTQLGMYVEGGWAAKWGLAGNRDFARVAIANITNDLLHAVVIKYLSKKGGWRGKIGNATLLFHGEEHLRLGIANLRFVANNNDPSAVFQNHPNQMPIWADSTPCWWGKK